MFRISILFLALLISGCTYWPSGIYFRHGITQYQGEGTIRDVSQRALFFGSRGYVVEFDKFDLGSAYDKHFRLANLPTIANGSVHINLAIEDEELSWSNLNSIDSLRRKLEAGLTIWLTDSAGVTVTGFSTKIRTMSWSSPVHGYGGCWLYTSPGSYFKPRPGETYSLKVRYSPDATLRGKHGCIYLYSGCGGS